MWPALPGWHEPGSTGPVPGNEWRDDPTDAGQIVITPGALAGIAIGTRALAQPGARVLLESPMYPNAIAGFTRRLAEQRDTLEGAQVLPVQFQADTIRVAEVHAGIGSPVRAQIVDTRLVQFLLRRVELPGSH